MLLAHIYSFEQRVETAKYYSSRKSADITQGPAYLGKLYIGHGSFRKNKLNVLLFLIMQLFSIFYTRQFLIILISNVSLTTSKCGVQIPCTLGVREITGFSNFVILRPLELFNISMAFLISFGV